MNEKNEKAVPNGKSFDFREVGDIENFVAVPNGTYRARVAEVRVKKARDGSDLWSIRWVVDDGPFAEKTAAWDNLTWSERGIRRVKLVLSRLGFETTGVLEILPEDLVGRCALVTIFAEEFVNPATGARQVRPRVPFSGYEQAPDRP
mgnify:CR=1 FL=1